MVQIPEEAVRLILKANNVVFVGTVGADKVPNISPRFVLAILENEKFLFADLFTNKTYANLKAWPKVTAAVIDRETMAGFQLKGEAAETTDEELIATANSRLKEFGFDQKPHRVWTLTVNEVDSLTPNENSKSPLISAYA